MTTVVLSFVAGSAMRDKVDVGISRLATSSAGDLVAASRGAVVASRGPTVPEGDYFSQMAELLKREYVDPIQDEQKLALGAVRGMVSSLGDMDSMYMDKPEFDAFLERRLGKYEGIGVDLSLIRPEITDEQLATAGIELPEGASQRPRGIPELVVSAVVPGGPADRAGVRPGDIVEEVDGHWVVSTRLLLELRKAQRDAAEGKLKQEELAKIRREVRDKSEKNVLPLRAKEKLQVGDSGQLSVKWRRGNATLDTTLAKAPSDMPGFGAENGVIRLPFRTGDADRLAGALRGKTSAVLDLRNNVNGDIGEMKLALEAVAPKGVIGYLVNQRTGKPSELNVAKGNGKPPSLTLRVDSTTRGAAEIFALALSAKGVAKLEGSLTGGDRMIKEIVSLPGGAGFTLATAEFRPRLVEATKPKSGGRS